MHTAKIFSQPITSMLGVKRSENTNYLLHLPFSKQLTNHVDVLHAAAIYGFAELTNGYLLNRLFPQYAENTVPLLRKSTAKYRQMAETDLFSKAEVVNGAIAELASELEERGRIHIHIDVRLYNVREEEVFRCLFEWFVTFKRAA